MTGGVAGAGGFETAEDEDKGAGGRHEYKDTTKETEKMYTINIKDIKDVDTKDLKETQETKVNKFSSTSLLPPPTCSLLVGGECRWRDVDEGVKGCVCSRLLCLHPLLFLWPLSKPPLIPLSLPSLSSTPCSSL